MAIKLADTLAPMSEFPAAMAEHIGFSDGATLQEKFDNKELGGGDNSVTLTQEEFELLSEEERLNGLYYTYDTKRIYKNGVQYGASEPIPLTVKEYKALKAAGAIDEKQDYLVEADAEGILLEASDIGYSNAVSNLPCTTVQGAVDKVSEKVDGLISDTSSSTTNTYSSAMVDTKLEKKLFAWSNSPSALLGFEAKGTYTIEEFMKALYAVNSSGSVTLWFSNSVAINVKHNDTTVTLNGGSLIWNGTDINKAWQAMSVTYIPASGNNIYKIRYATDGDINPLSQGIEVYGGEETIDFTNPIFQFEGSENTTDTYTYTTVQKTMFVCSIGGVNSTSDTETDKIAYCRIVVNNLVLCSAVMQGDATSGLGNSCILPKGTQITMTLRSRKNQRAQIFAFAIK